MKRNKMLSIEQSAIVDLQQGLKVFYYVAMSRRLICAQIPVGHVSSVTAICLTLGKEDL